MEHEEIELRHQATMDIFQSVQGYITKLVSQGESAGAGGSNGAAKMKILLLDKDTVRDVLGIW